MSVFKNHHPELLAKMNGSEEQMGKLLENIDSPWHFWYEPVINGGRTPDFAIWSNDKTLPAIFIIELKAWTADYITCITSSEVHLKNRRESHPIPKLRSITENILDELKVHYKSAPGLEDIPVIPILCFNKIKQDNLPASFIEEDMYILTSEALLSPDVLKKAMEQIARNEYSGFEMPPVSRAIQKVIDQKIDLSSNVQVANGNVNPTASLSTANKYDHTLPSSLDSLQRSIAIDRSNGHFLLSGLPGTGKTIVLLARASWYCQHFPGNRVLFIVNQKVLNNNLRQKYEHQFASGRSSNIHFSTFTSWLKFAYPDVRQSFREVDIKERDQIIDSVVEKIKAGEIKPRRNLNKWGLILVDEAHQIKPEWLSLLPVHAQPYSDSPNVWISYDNGQGIYKNRRFHGPTIGLNFTGRSRRLSRMYRCGMLTWLFAACCHPGSLQSYQKELANEFIEFTKKGEPPLPIQAQTLEQQAHLLKDELKARIKSGQLKPADVCIYYPVARHTEYDLYPNSNIKRILDRTFADLGGIEWVAIEKDAADWTSNRIRACSFTSSQGIDSPVSVLFGIEMFRMFTGDQQWVDAEALFYTVLTRATSLIILTFKTLEDPDCRFQSALYQGTKDAIYLTNQLKDLQPVQEGEQSIYRLNWKELDALFQSRRA